MSYCRWSTDMFRCDLYCYQNCSGGYSTHVAGRTKDVPEGYPQPPEITKDTIPAYLEWQDKFHADREKWPWRYLNLPHDGETFNDDLAGFKQRVTDLRAMGYRIPDDCYQAIMEETEEN